MALMSVRFGSSDLEKAANFYDATLAAIGLDDIRIPMGATALLYRFPNGVHFMVAAPRNGEPATHGNGDTLGLSATDTAAVDRWHAAGIAHSGKCAGPPGLREAAGGRYGAYLLDPDGHKLCAYAEG